MNRQLDEPVPEYWPIPNTPLPIPHTFTPIAHPAVPLETYIEVSAVPPDEFSTRNCGYVEYILSVPLISKV